MHYRRFMEIAESLPATVDLPFRLRDRDGVIHVEISANEDPDDLGHPLVAVGYDEERFRGFPVMTAQIQYAGRGVRAWMGWVQVIERHDDDGNVAAGVDGLPLFGASPLYTFGYLPTLSDSPANPDHPDGNWVADSFLVAIPDVVRTRRFFPIVGFQWGYRLVGGRAVELFTPEPIGKERWERHRALLEESCPEWTFLAGAVS